MEPFEVLGYEVTEQSLGTAGLAVSLAGATVGTVWLVAYDGRIPSFLLVALAALLGWVSFMLRWPYEPSELPAE